MTEHSVDGSMTLLLVLGAGASRSLGTDGTPMPLMGDWSDALCHALDERESNLAAACHLERGLSGPQFEENLGLLLRWAEVLELGERFRGLAGPQTGDDPTGLLEARQRTKARLDVVMETLNSTLYDQFGQTRVDDRRAATAYDNLLDALGQPQLMVATTNYDRVVESALETLGRRVDTGFRGRPYSAKTLQPEGLVHARDEAIPVIHLHGAVGWYESNGLVEEHHANKEYNRTLGVPVVLYPDPDKDPTNDAIVSKLWHEFELALDVTDGVLVIGHSLHDPALERALRRVSSSKPVIVSYFDQSDARRLTTMVPGGLLVEMDFGPDSMIDPRIASRLRSDRQPVRKSSVNNSVGTRS